MNDTTKSVFVGQDLIINPDDNQKVARAKGRLKRVQYMLDKLDESHERRAFFLREKRILENVLEIERGIF